MIKIKSIEEYQKFKEIKKDNRKSLWTNQYFFEREIISLIEQEVLYLLNSDNNFIFLVEEKQRYLLFATIYESQEKLVIPQKLDKPIIVEFVEKGNRSTNRYMRTWLKENKFKLYATNLEMYHSENNNEVCRSFDIDYDYAKLSDYEDILSLYSSGLDALSNPFPTYKEFELLIENNNVIVFKNKNKIIGSVSLDKTNIRYTTISHLVVDELFRGCGYGAMIMQWVIRNKQGNFNLWVNSENITAISLYHKLGFKKTNKMSYQFKGGIK